MRRGGEAKGENGRTSVGSRLGAEEASREAAMQQAIFIDGELTSVQFGKRAYGLTIRVPASQQAFGQLQQLASGHVQVITQTGRKVGLGVRAQITPTGAPAPSFPAWEPPTRVAAGGDDVHQLRQELEQLRSLVTRQMVPAGR